MKFGAGEIDYVSYVYALLHDVLGSATERTRLYLRSIGRAMEGIVTIMTAGVADYSRKSNPTICFTRPLEAALTDSLYGN